jgi:hypothetical protein
MEQTIQNTSANASGQIDFIMAGDFNRHHPVWGGNHVNRNRMGLQHLIWAVVSIKKACVWTRFTANKSPLDMSDALYFLKSICVCAVLPLAELSLWPTNLSHIMITYRGFSSENTQSSTATAAATCLLQPAYCGRTKLVAVN